MSRSSSILEQVKGIEMKNIDKIKSLPAWEMAEFIYKVSNNSTQITTCNKLCAECEYSDSYCTFQIAEWLQSEVEE